METWIVRFVWNGPFLMCKIFKLAITKFHQYKCWSSYHFYVVILQHWNLSFHSFMRAFSIIHTFAISNYSSFHFIVLLHFIFYVHFDKNIFTMIQLPHFHWPSIRHLHTNEILALIILFIWNCILLYNFLNLFLWKFFFW